jgi:hypothetical protein
MPSVTSEVIFIAGEYSPTQTGKDRWTLRAIDGREFGAWEQPLYDAVMQHLQEPLVCEVGSKQSDTGTWWNTLYAIPALNVRSSPPPKGGPQSPTTSPTVGGLDAVLLTGIGTSLMRIADSLESLVMFQTEQALGTSNPANAPMEEPPAP